MAASTADRSAHASSTVRTRRGGRSANDPSCSAVKHTTSHRPKAGRAVLISPSWPGLAGAQPTVAATRDPFRPAPCSAVPGVPAPAPTAVPAPGPAPPPTVVSAPSPATPPGPASPPAPESPLAPEVPPASPIPPAGPSPRAVAPYSEGNLFSNTTTSYSGAGISVGRPGRDGSSGQCSAGGKNVRPCRWAATITHSPVSGSHRSPDSGPGTGRSSAVRSLVSGTEARPLPGDSS